jgi:hypothetical protein
MSAYLTLVATRTLAAIEADRLKRAIGDVSGKAAGALSVEQKGQEAGAPLIVMTDGIPVTVVPMGFALPGDAVSEPLRRNLAWPDAPSAIASSRAHVIVAALSTPADHASAIKAASAVTRVAAAVCKTTDALAVIWTAGEVVSEPRTFCDEAGQLSQGTMPVTQWISLLFEKNTNPSGGMTELTVMTDGLRSFIGREIELHGGRKPVHESVGFVLNLCGYLLQEGPVIKDGDSLGLTENAELKATHLEAGRRPNVPVIKVGYLPVSGARKQ